jgi:hypothetical protein
MQRKAAAGLLLACIGLEREREVLFEVRSSQALVVLDLQSLGAVGGDGDNLCSEQRSGAGVLSSRSPASSSPGSTACRRA